MTIARTCPCGAKFEGPTNKRFCSRECQNRARGQRDRELPATNVHVVIPDTQVKPGVPTDHLQWIGRYIEDKFGQATVDESVNLTVVHLGDHWDMPSLSSYDKGKRSMEGRRVREDLDAGNRGMEVLSDPFEWMVARRVLLRGNHEDRLHRATDEDAQLEGLLSDADFLAPGWDVVPFREVRNLDGISYAHYFENPMTGRPLSGQNVELRLKTIGASFTMGHQQTLMYGLRFVQGRSQHGLVAGACYQHDEDYKGPQGNAHWRGIIVCHQVEDGSYDPMFVSLDYLCRRYEGHPLAAHAGVEL